MYKDEILKLIEESPLKIDTDIQISGSPPTMASSEFITNREQGIWAEQVVLKAINENSEEYFAIEYGRSESISAGDEGFEEFYREYQKELNKIGKKPDLLIFKIDDFPQKNIDIKNDEHVKKAIAAIEVRSSSFLVGKYTEFMKDRQKQAIDKCNEVKKAIIETELGDLLKRKNETLYNLLYNATDDTFRELNFRCPSWS